jgi:hypothetical protein
MALSAGYLLMSGAERAYVAKTGDGGLDRRGDAARRPVQARRADGLRVHVHLRRAIAKVDANSHAPLAPRAKAWAQAEVDRTYAMFVDAVAKHRGLSADAVRATEARSSTPTRRSRPTSSTACHADRAVTALEAEIRAMPAAPLLPARGWPRASLKENKR